MSSFTTPLRVEPVSAQLWRLTENFEYKIGDLSSNESVRVPKGFITDFASTPRIFWSILPPWGKYGKAAVVHDFLYQFHRITKTIGGTEHTLYIGRKEADSIFLEAMKVLGVNAVTRRVMWATVRVFGATAWKNL